MEKLTRTNAPFLPRQLLATLSLVLFSTTTMGADFVEDKPKAAVPYGEACNIASTTNKWACNDKLGTCMHAAIENASKVLISTGEAPDIISTSWLKKGGNPLNPDDWSAHSVVKVTVAAPCWRFWNRNPDTKFMTWGGLYDSLDSVYNGFKMEPGTRCDRTDDLVTYIQRQTKNGDPKGWYWNAPEPPGGRVLPEPTGGWKNGTPPGGSGGPCSRGLCFPRFIGPRVCGGLKGVANGLAGLAPDIAAALGIQVANSMGFSDEASQFIGAGAMVGGVWATEAAMTGTLGLQISVLGSGAAGVGITGASLGVAGVAGAVVGGGMIWNIESNWANVSADKKEYMNSRFNSLKDQCLSGQNTGKKGQPDSPECFSDKQQAEDFVNDCKNWITDEMNKESRRYDQDLLAGNECPWWSMWCRR